MKNNTRKAYLTILLAIALLPMTMVICYKQCSGNPIKQIPFSYDRQHVEKLSKVEETNPYWQKHGFILKKVDELEDSLAEIYHVTGENGMGWSDEGGDFERIRIKLKNKKVVEYDNRDGWLEIFKKGKYGSGSIADFLKTPEKSQKIKKHPYGVTLDMGKGDQILMLFGYKYATDPARLLTLIYIGKDQAEMIFNTYFTLFEIKENQEGYSLIGRISRDGSHADPYQIVIKDGKLTFEKLPLKKVYEGQEPHIILQNAKGWSLNEQPGDFTRVEIVAPPGSENQKNQVFNVDDYNNVWTLFPTSIKLPAHTTTIKQTPYFIMLESPIDRTIILILSKGDHRDSVAACLTVLQLAPYYPDYLFNGYFRLQEITEDDIAYHLLGTRPHTEDPNKVHEITINKAAMAKVTCNW